MKSDMKSPLAESIELYLAHKHALGKQLAKVGPMLRWLDKYLVDQDVTDLRQISSDHIAAFVDSRPLRTPRSYNALIGGIQGMFDWMVVHEMLPESPLRCAKQRVPPSRRPFLFTQEHARQLFEAAEQLPSTARAQNREGPTR